MPYRPRRRRLALLAAVSAALAGVLAASSAAHARPMASPTSRTTTLTVDSSTTAPTPHLGVVWTVLHHRCETVTKRVRVRRHGHTSVHDERVRKCGFHPVKTTSDVHLAWHQSGIAFGHLTLAGQPIANALVAVTKTPETGTVAASTVTTDAEGRFSVPFSGPDKLLSLSYSPTQGVQYAVGAIIHAQAFLSLNIGHLTAGRRGHFYGVVSGGPIPENLYVQFYYLSASAGWQPFAGLADVGQHTGRWQANLPIPRAAAGYRYEIRATVVPSAYWPWARTTSAVVTRTVTS